MKILKNYDLDLINYIKIFVKMTYFRVIVKKVCLEVKNEGEVLFNSKVHNGEVIIMVKVYIDVKDVKLKNYIQKKVDLIKVIYIGMKIVVRIKGVVDSGKNYN